VGPLLTLGNQDIWAEYNELRSFFEEIDCPYAESTIIPHTSRLFEQHTDTENYVHARTFFEMLGIKDYYDIDKYDRDAPQILHDLNTPIPIDLREKFNLIIDGGTMEHIFDVRQVMENIVSMCRTSGRIVHMTPTSNFMDHGFYSFSPCFFYDFYCVNGFDDFVCYVFQINPDNLRDPSPFFEYHYGMDLRPLIDPGRRILVFFAARKAREIERLVIPTQGAFTLDAANAPEPVPTSRNGPGSVSLIERFVPAFALPYLKPVRPLLGAIRRSVVSRKREATPTYDRLPRM